MRFRLNRLPPLSPHKLRMRQISDCELTELTALLSRFSLNLELVANDASIPGSYWGAPEAGLIRSTVYARSDTPIHSLLHEASHTICMSESRRKRLHTDAGGDFDEENAVCYLQILLADTIPGFSSQQCMLDMDEWGYTFRLGSTRRWFEEDASDALSWLKQTKTTALTAFSSQNHSVFNDTSTFLP